MSEKQEDGRRPVLRTLPYFLNPDDKEVKPIPVDVHTGLWLDKYLLKQAKGLGEIKAKHFEQTVRPVDALYSQFFDRWEKSLAVAGVQTHKATVQGRLAIGLGGESVLETAISLHRTYGVPYIPGSALKGLAAHYAAKRLGDAWKKERAKGEDGKPEINPYTILFGDTDIAGYVTFYDALYVPNSAPKNTPLALDVINVHHPDYYGGKDVPPADWDSPTPVSFLSATGSYLIALGGPKEWVDAAFKILACALGEEGIGAKTSSGYGRMKFDTDTSQTPQKEPHALIQKRLLAETPPAGRLRGTVVNVQGSTARINPAKGGRQEFIHVNGLRKQAVLREGQVVEYKIGQYQGRPQAQDAEILLEPEN